MEATFIRDLEGWNGEARLYKLSEPYKYQDAWLSEQNKNKPNVCEYVIVSAVDAMFSGPETYVFPATEDGEAIDYLELPGSFRGDLDHEQAILGFCGTEGW